MIIRQVAKKNEAFSTRNGIAVLMTGVLWSCYSLASQLNAFCSIKLHLNMNVWAFIIVRIKMVS